MTSIFLTKLIYNIFGYGLEVDDLLGSVVVMLLKNVKKMALAKYLL